MLEPAEPTAWRAETSAFLGKHVRVRLDDDGKVIVTGKLLSYGEGGDFVVQTDDGFLSFLLP